MTELTAHDGGKDYTVRKLKNKDVWGGARIAAKVLADPQLSMTAAQISSNSDLGENERNMALMVTVVSSLMEHAPNDVEAFLMDMVGLEREQWNELPPEVTFEVIAELVEREDFLPTVHSVKKLSAVAKKAFSNYQSTTKDSTAGQTENS